MPNPDPNAPAAGVSLSLNGNDVDLTDAERLALTPVDPAVAPAAVAPPAGDPPVAPPVAEPAAAVPPVAPAAAAPPVAPAAAPVDPPLAAAIPAAAPPPLITPFVPQLASDGRDLKAEMDKVKGDLVALGEAYAKGGMDDDAYERDREALIDLRTDLRVGMALAEQAQSINQQNADQSWDYVQRQFLEQPANAAIAANKFVLTAFTAALQDVVDEAFAKKETLTDWDVLQRGRQKLEQANLLAPAAGVVQPAPSEPAPAAVPGAPPVRLPDMSNVPTTLSAAPTAADPSLPTTAENYSALGIEDVEERMARMSDGDRDRLLRTTPGAYVD